MFGEEKKEKEKIGRVYVCIALILETQEEG